jgi:polysaccharide export outer membrane protein
MKTFFVLMTSLTLGLLAMIAPAAAEGYGVHSGDILKLEVLEDPSIDRTLLVAPDGRISLPQVGTLKVAGQTVEEIGAAIAAKLAVNFATPPTVSVSLQQLAAPKAPGAAAAPATTDIYVMGEANKPGKLALTPRTTVLQAFAEMGGFTKFAATKRIQLRRTDKNGAPVIINLNFEAIQAGSTADGNIRLQEGDVILVPQRRLFE